MKRFTIFVVALLNLIFICQAQNEKKEQNNTVENALKKQKGFKKENLFISGNLGLQIGNYTNINLSPQIGYKFSKYIAAGFGVNFQYVSVKNTVIYNRVVNKFTQGVWGSNLFLRAYPNEHLMLQIQPEINHLTGKEKNANNDEIYSVSQTVSSLLVGGGVVIPITNKSSLVATVFYDVLQNFYSPYRNKPIYNVGFNIGF